MSDLLPSNQNPHANAWPKIAVSKPLMEFTHGGIIAKNGEDGGAWGPGLARPGDVAREPQDRLQTSLDSTAQQPAAFALL